MFSEKINVLMGKNLLRTITDRASAQGPKIRINGREYINFGSNDYLGLSSNPSLVLKAKHALDTFGFGSGSSRLLCGGSILHRQLEEDIAQFKSTESALVFNSGFDANAGIIPALSDADTVLFSDELNHASIVDGCRLSRGKTVVYTHKDASHLEKLLQKTLSPKKIIITDTVFSMDGDIAPIGLLVGLCKKYNAMLYLDDAHGTGVLGNGRGALSHFRIHSEPWIVQMGTFSKAFGSFGAFLAAEHDTITWVQNTARSFLYTTALPPCVIAASIAAIVLVREDSSLIRRLWTNRDNAASGLTDIGFDIMGSETPIIPVKTGSVEATLKIARYLFEHGIFAPAIRPPTARAPRIRLSITAAHSGEDIARLLYTLKKA